MVGFLTLSYARAPKRGRFRLWGWLGLGLIVAAEYFLLRRLPWVTTFFTPLVWSGYVLFADALVFSLRRDSRLASEPKQLLSLAFWSVPLWLLFEAYNLRLSNWTYVGLPESPVVRGAGYVWSFATIWPAIFETADLLQELTVDSGGAKRPRPYTSTTRIGFILLGLAMVTVPVLLPARVGQYLFGTVWVGFIFLLDPITYHWNGRSLLQEWEQGQTSRLKSLLAAGLVCGVLWEFWNYWASAKWIYVFSIGQSVKVFEMPLPGYLGFPPFALECFVMYEFLRTLKIRYFPPRMESGWQRPRAAGPANGLRIAMKRNRTLLTLTLILVLAISWNGAGLPAPSPRDGAAPVRTEREEIRQLERQGLDSMMNGDLSAAIEAFREIQRRDPESPLGYLLEGDATWWLIYYSTGDLVDPDVFDVARSDTTPYDARYEELVNVAIEKSRRGARERQDEAQNFLNEGLAYALRARLVGVRGKDLPTARAGKKMRALLLRAIELDPNLNDAYLGLGLYNYFVDTLPTIVKMLKVFIFLPGGSREMGLQQLQRAAEKGEMTRSEAKFLLAKDYSRRNEMQNARSLELFQELEREYPRNPLWALLEGTLYCRLGQGGACEQLYRQVFTKTAGEQSVPAKGLHSAARAALQKLHPDERFGE